MIPLEIIEHKEERIAIKKRYKSVINDEIFLKEFVDMGFIEIDETTNTYHITKLGKEYIEEFYN